MSSIRIGKSIAAGVLGGGVAIAIHELSPSLIINIDLPLAYVAAAGTIGTLYFKYGMKYAIFASTVGSFLAGLLLILLGAETAANTHKVIPIAMFAGIWFSTLAFRKFTVTESVAMTRDQAELDELHPDERARILAERSQKKGA